MVDCNVCGSEFITCDINVFAIVVCVISVSNIFANDGFFVCHGRNSLFITFWCLSRFGIFSRSIINLELDRFFEVNNVSTSAVEAGAVISLELDRFFEKK